MMPMIAFCIAVVPFQVQHKETTVKAIPQPTRSSHEAKFLTVFGRSLANLRLSDLESHLGRGQTVPGTHSTSGRVWEKGRLTVRADAGLRWGNVGYVDLLQIESAAKGQLPREYAQLLASPLDKLRFGQTLSTAKALFGQFGLQLVWEDGSLTRKDVLSMGRRKGRLQVTLLLQGDGKLEQIEFLVNSEDVRVH